MLGRLFEYESFKPQDSNFFSATRKWCVSIDGKRHHISERIDFTGENNAESKSWVFVDLCKGECSCKKGEQDEIPEDTLKKVFGLLSLK